MVAVTEAGDRAPLQPLADATDPDYDFAIYRLPEPLPGIGVLQARERGEPIERGLDVIFSGFPHGFPSLLLQCAIVAGEEDDARFYIDGSVNGGNSGGPVVAAESGRVVGFITASRFLEGENLAALAREAEVLAQHCNRLAQGGRVEIMGISFTDFAALVAGSNLILRRALEANANTGLGIATTVDVLLEALAESGI